MRMLASKAQLRDSFLRWSLFTVPTCVLLGFLSGVFGGSPDSMWFQSLNKPALFPDPRWFGIVWTILYILMGFTLALVCAAWGARGRIAALVAFAVQFALNLAWTPVFFGLHQMSIALAVILMLILAVVVTMVLFWRVRKLAAMLLLPYLAWICFAALLNYEFLAMNPDADGVGDPTRAVQRIAI
ncbi:MAG: TspO/MBR family protein [Pontixanthobacter sp.]